MNIVEITDDLEKKKLHENEKILVFYILNKQEKIP